MIWMYRLLHIVVHLGALAPLVWLFYAIPQGYFGGDPIKELIHFLGMGAMRLLLLSLLISPVAKKLKFGKLMRLRRPLGLWCFTWASAHFYCWMAFDLGWQWQLIVEEIVKRKYIVIGFSAWLILLALAVTSIPKIMRKMGKYWKKLHAWVYLVVILISIHFWMAVKSGWIEPFVYAFMGLVLLWFRRQYLLRKITH